MKFLVIDNKMNAYRVLSSMLRNYISDVEDVDTANTYDTAMNLYENKNYDLIFIAMKSRIGNVYTIIDDLRKIYYNASIIPYAEEFKTEDLHRLIQMRVINVLEFPFQESKFEVVIQNFLKERIQQRSWLLDDRQALVQSANELIEFSFIYSVLFNGDLNWEWKRYQYLLNISGSGYVMFVSVSQNRKQGQLPYERYAKIIKKGVTSGYHCIVGKEITGHIVLFVMAKYGLERDRSTSHVERVHYAQYVKKVFKDIFHIDVKVGVGSMKSVDKLPISYEEALRSVRYDGNVSLSQSKQLEAATSENYSFYIEMEQKFLDNIREGSQEAVNSFSTLLEMMNHYDMNDKKNKIFELLVMASHIARYDGKNESEYTDYMELGRQLDHMDNESINTWACRSVSYILKSIRDIQNTGAYADIRKVLRYVDNHYDEDITLEDAASIINVSPQYFSRIFKEQTGNTFVDYLTRTRMKKAKEWLAYSSQTVQEICFKVGYKDPNYFARVFKKNVGVTPRQYKSQKNNRENVQKSI